MSETAQKTPIQRAVETVGGQSKLAALLGDGVAPALVWQWVNGRRPVAAKHCVGIEAATGGAVSCHDLRPDVFPARAFPQQSNDSQRAA